MDVSHPFELREARADDHDDVKAITANTWPQREGQDYLGRVYPRWLDAGDRPKHTLVATHDGTAVAIAQCVRLTDTEAWGQGLRVHPDYRELGLSRQLTGALFAWASDNGATVVRAMVHAWNEAGLGQARACGYRPAGTFRWVHPAVGSDDRAAAHLEATPRPWTRPPPPASVDDDPAAAWRAFAGSEAADVVGGLGLSLDESWAVAELTPAVLARAADETAVIAVRTETGTPGMAYRSRTFEREDEAGDPLTVAEYGLATWSDTGTAALVLDAIARDADAIGADRARVAVPDQPTFVSDAARCRAEVAESAEVIMAADLTGTIDHATVFDEAG